MLSTFPLHRNPPLAPNLHYIPAQPRFLNLNFPAATISTRLFSTPSSTSAPAVANTAAGDEFGVELGRLLALLPDELRAKISKHPEFRELIEVVLDLGRKPLARFPSGDFALSDSAVTAQDLEFGTSQVGDFVVDNRAGISRTLHRISAIRNRKGRIIGLTCRVGRAIPGSANALKDLVQGGASLLLIGPPGVGKTTIIRDIARMLANDYKNRVMIVDTSNEIGGDGDIPHAGIGNARRMQVPDTDLQHKVLIEAVENHMPQVIVIDEIGTKLEAMAASTISQRGIQLVATAHGVTIENLIMNPALEILVGGVQNVTLGDEEANRRGVQKTVQERKGPSTFACGVEIISKTELRVHRNLEGTVDAILSGRSPAVEVRKITSKGVEKTIKSEMSVDLSEKEDQEIDGDDSEYNIDKTPYSFPSEIDSDDGPDICEESALSLFIYGIPEANVMQGIKKVGMDMVVRLTDNISEADALLALHSKLKKNQGIQAVAKSRKIPMYITKTSSLVHLTKALQALADAFEDNNDLGSSDDIKMSEKLDALEEVRIAIEKVVIPQGEPVELLPRPSHILSLQMDLIRNYQLRFEKVSKGPVPCLRILPFQTRLDDDEGTNDQEETNDVNAALDDLDGFAGANGPYFIERLPLLPDSD